MAEPLFAISNVKSEAWTFSLIMWNQYGKMFIKNKQSSQILQRRLQVHYTKFDNKLKVQNVSPFPSSTPFPYLYIVLSHKVLW